MAPSPPPEPPSPSLDWEALLTNGHGWHPGVRAVFRRLPHGPRCKVCSAPFAGMGGRATRVLGFRPSRKNPNFCARCIEALPPGGAEIDIAVLFADVRGSTALGEALGATAFARLMARFYEVATDVLLTHDAIIDKLIGDEVMALFIPGISGPEYRRRACQAGLDLLRAVQSPDGQPPWLPIGVAVHAGLAYTGNVGASGVADFTALGDTVNTAARLQAAAAAGQLVVSEEAYGPTVDGHGHLERRDLQIRGRTQSVTVHVLRP